jgi:steroid 5-alpha reductase family enzyme
MNILMTINLDLMLESLKWLLLLAAGTWFVSFIIEDVSIVDYIWSPLTLLAVVTYAYITGLDNPVSIALFLMVAMWSIRLTLFLVKRGRNHPEDRRYQVIRERNSPNFGYKSLYLIFIFQALVAWVLSSLFVPIFDSSSEQVWSLWHSIGVLVWLFGFVYETVADRQLHYFNSLVIKQGSTLNTGLWRYCRHPNYFGEFCIWWAWFIFAIPTASVWIVLGPLLMSYLLLKFSGVGNMEQGITERRPDYQAYIDSTNTFFPGKPRKKVVDS